MFLLYHSEGYDVCGRGSANVISTTCILHHVVVCWVTAVGIRAIVLTLGWKPSIGIEPLGFY